MEMSDRDDETPPIRGSTRPGHAVREIVRPEGCEGDAVRSNRGHSRRDTDEFTAPDEWGETTGVRERREIEGRLGSLELAIVDIHGEKGTNGKLGKVSDRVKLILWIGGLVVAAAVGAVGTALKSAQESGEETGRLREQVEQSAAAINDLRDLVWDLARNPSPKGIVP
jgi:hypothetical protein